MMKPRGLTLVAIIAIPILAGLSLPSWSRSEETKAVLHTKTFKLDPNLFLLNLENVSALHSGDATNNGPTKTFSDVTTNVGTVDDGTVDSGQNRRVQYFPDSESEMRLLIASYFNEFGVNLAPPKGMSFHERQSTLAVRATDEDFKIIEQAVNALNTMPPEVALKVRYVEASDEDIFEPGFEWLFKMIANNGNTVPSVAGILTDPQFKLLLNQMEKRIGAGSLHEAEGATLTGRQATFEFFEPKDKPKTNAEPAINMSLDETNKTFSLDIVPEVEKDGYTIQMTLIPTATEYFDPPAPGNFVATATNSSHIPISGPLPRSRVRQAVVNCTVWDGQTAVLLVSPAFAPSHKTNIVIFVTPVVVDSAGKRKNSETNMPFAQKAVPPQSVH